MPENISVFHYLNTSHACVYAAGHAQIWTSVKNHYKFISEKILVIYCQMYAKKKMFDY